MGGKGIEKKGNADKIRNNVLVIVVQDSIVKQNALFKLKEGVNRNISCVTNRTANVY